MRGGILYLSIVSSYRKRRLKVSSRLLLVPMEDAVVFPGMSLTLTVDVGDEERVLLVPRHEQEFATVGTVAEVSEPIPLPGRARAVALQGLHRGPAGAAHAPAHA